MGVGISAGAAVPRGGRRAQRVPGVLLGVLGMWLVQGCEADAGAASNGASGTSVSCQPGTQAFCDCPGGPQQLAQCSAAGDGYLACPCQAGPGTGGAQAGGGGVQTGGGGAPAGAGGQGTGAVLATGGESGTGGQGSGGEQGVGGQGTGGVDDPSDPHAALRAACLTHINMHRASIGLDPLVRGTAEQEACADEGARYDSENGAHQSAGNCSGLGAQNTCPGWPAPGGDVAGALTGCLDQMWAEGEPPVPVPDCIDDYVDCFLVHGHYINMSAPSSRVVACGFYQQPDGSWWMNQDFGY